MQLGKDARRARPKLGLVGLTDAEAMAAREFALQVSLLVVVVPPKLGLPRESLFTPHCSAVHPAMEVLSESQRAPIGYRFDSFESH